MNRIVVITGASAGVGRATARAFAHEGDTIVLLSRNQKRLQQAKEEIEKAGQQALIIPCDVANIEEVNAAAEQIAQVFGKIDVWVNNAMVTVYSNVWETTPEEFRRVTEVTYLGTVYGTMAALRQMLPQNKGIIIQVGSALAYRAIPLQSAYCGAKHAIQGFSESLRSELLATGKNITVSMVQLPALNTPQFSWARSRMSKNPQPVPPIYQPEVAAEAIVWASTRHKREFVVGWRNQLIIWLNKFFPGIGDKYLAQHLVDQQTDEQIRRTKDNLFETVDADFAARGDFSHRAKDKDWWFNFYKKI